MRSWTIVSAFATWRGAIGLTSLLGAGGACVAFGAIAMGCLDRPIEPVDPRTTSSGVDVLGQSAVDKIDLLLVIDNSGSMADKQDILVEAVPRLVERLVTPLCIDPASGLPVDRDEDGECPDGIAPEFKPIKDINIGIISSSIGSVGTSTCDVTETTITPSDKGQLLYRTNPLSTTNDAVTYRDLGFLAWDPEGKRPCPDNPKETCPGTADREELIATLTTMVTGVGEFGCGYEAPLEAAYRFLADPTPWGTLTNVENTVTLSGTDDRVLAQRKAFLRPDSLLAVILLTDENDCSFRADNLGGYAANGDLAMTRARDECESDPDAPCCASCWDLPPEGCEGDGGCADPGNKQNPDNYFPAPLASGVDQNESHANLRCWDQKRRFGTDFLYPTERYVNAFSKAGIDPDRLDLAAEPGDGVLNPIFTAADGTERASDLVFVAGIVGVPWQLISRKDEKGVAALADGLNADGERVGGFRTFAELEDDKGWEQMLAGSAKDQPDSPLMIESPEARETSDADQLINGGEWDTDYGDLQYACIFELPEPCDPEGDNFECADCGLESVGSEGNPPNGNPLCDPAKKNRQTHAKAYPGTRILQVLRGLQGQGIPASICPDQLGDVTAKNYGYTPAVFAIIDRLKVALTSSCQPRQLVADSEGNTPCIVIEASDSDGDKDGSTTAECAEHCKEAGRAPIGERTKNAQEKVRATLDAEESPEADTYDCLCEIQQLQGKPKDDDWETSDRYLCQNREIPPKEVNGWCYVDATTTPPIGNPELEEIAKCPSTEQRVVRFVNNGAVASGGRHYITCSGDAAGAE